MSTVTAHDPLIQQTLLGEAVDEGPAGVFVMGEERKYAAVNETACALLGYDRGTLLALHPDEVSPGPDAIRWDEGAFGEAALRTKDGGTVRVSYRVAETTVARLRFWVAVVLPLGA